MGKRQHGEEARWFSRMTTYYSTSSVVFDLLLPCTKKEAFLLALPIYRQDDISKPKVDYCFTYK